VNRSLTIRLLLGTLVIVTGLVIFSYTHARASRQVDPSTNGEGKCECSKSQSPFVLWESLAHNLLISKS
jgi:hypothetical protein